MIKNISIQSIIKRIWPIAIIVLIGLVPLLWFKTGCFIAGGDSSLYLAPDALIKDYSTAWNPSLNGGDCNSFICVLTPLVYFWLILKKIGLSNVLIEKLFFITLWLSTALVIYLLAKKISIQEDRNSRIVGVFAALAYLFNPHTMISPIDYIVRLVYLGMPLLFLLVIKALNSRNYLKYGVSFGLATFVTASAWANPAAAIVIFFPSLLLLFFKLVFGRHRGQTIKVAVLCLIFFYLFNAWWLHSFIFTLMEKAETIQKAVSGWNVTNSTKIHEVFRFMGLWAFRSGHFNMPYYPYHEVYYKFPIVLLTYFAPIMVMTLFLSKGKLSKIVIFLAFLFITGVFLAKGTNTPFGQIYKFLFAHVPGFWIFREPFAKFTPLVVFSMSILFGLAVSNILTVISKNSRLKKRKILVVISFALIVIISAFPLLSDTCIWHYWNGSMRTMHTKIPGYWEQCENWFKKNDSIGRVLILPKYSYGTGVFEWEHGFNGAPEESLIPNPKIKYISSKRTYGDDVVNRCYDSLFSEEDMNVLSGMINAFSIKHILHFRDVSWQYALKDTYPPEKIEEMLNKLNIVNRVKRFGKIDVYEINDRYSSPMIYIPEHIISVGGNSSLLVSLLKHGYLRKSEAMFFPEDSQPHISGEIDDSVTEYIIHKENFTLEHLADKSKKISYFYENLANQSSKQMKIDFEIPYNSTSNIQLDLKRETSIIRNVVLHKRILISPDMINNENNVNIKLDVSIMPRDNPYLLISYNKSTMAVDSVKVNMGVDKDGDGNIDEYCGKICSDNVPPGESYRGSLNMYETIKRNIKLTDTCVLKQLHISLAGCQFLKRDENIKRDLEIIIYGYKDVAIESAVDENFSDKTTLSSWKITSGGIKYRKWTTDKSCIIKAMFKENMRGKNYVTLEKKFSDIDILKYPYLDFDFDLESYHRQKILLIIGIDLNEDGLTDKEILYDIFFMKLDRQGILLNLKDELEAKLPNYNSYKLTHIKIKMSMPIFSDFTDKWNEFNLMSLNLYRVLHDDISSVMANTALRLDDKRISVKIKEVNKNSIKLCADNIAINKGKHSININPPKGYYVSTLLLKNAPFAAKLRKDSFKPSVRCTYANSTKHIVKIDIKKPSWLVMNTNFNPGWKAYSYRRISGEESKELNVHCRVNGYANAWYVPEAGKYIITIYFNPQRYVNTGILILFLTCILLSICLIIAILKNRILSKK